MREIKFRLWNSRGKASKYFYNQDQVLECLKQQITRQYDHEADGSAFEQYTGLRDKNGREIYEGDVLESVGAHREIQRQCVVSWCEEDAACKAMPIGYTGEPWRLGTLNPRFWQIIGNIHENASLLD